MLHTCVSELVLKSLNVACILMNSSGEIIFSDQVLTENWEGNPQLRTEDIIIWMYIIFMEDAGTFAAFFGGVSIPYVILKH